MRGLEKNGMRINEFEVIGAFESLERDLIELDALALDMLNNIDGRILELEAVMASKG